jgi:chromodomain-helicase-DNA-binding protein 1
MAIDRQPSRQGSTPEVRRKASGEGEQVRSTHGHKPSIDSQTPKSGDEYVERRMRSVRDNLARLKRANPKNYPDQKEKMIKVLKVELIAIGNFIRAETRNNKEMEDRLW